MDSLRRRGPAAAAVFAVLVVLAVCAVVVYAIVRSAVRPRATSLPRSGQAWDIATRHLQASAPDAAWRQFEEQCRRALIEGVEGRFSLYLEDVDTGRTCEILADERYNAWSLLKVAVAATVLKKVERGDVSLDQVLTLKPEELKTVVVVPSGAASGDSVTVRTLVGWLITLSDNTASFALARLFKASEFQETLVGMGFPSTPPDRQRNELPQVSARHCGNSLRSLYHASFLGRPLSDVLLALMAETVYDSQIRMGLPSDAKVAHKVGFNAGAGEFHDCGVVYLPGRPYILCVMSTGSTREESDRVISGLSRQVYAFMAGEPGRR